MNSKSRLTLLLAGLLGGCEPTVTPSAYPGTDSAGALVEVMRIDADSADLSVIGSPARRVALSMSGEVAVGQSQDGEVRVFDMEGRDVGRFGARGQGPGEFLSIYRVGWLGSSVWAIDSRQFRWVGLQVASGELTTRTLPPAVGSNGLVFREVYFQAVGRDASLYVAAFAPRLGAGAREGHGTLALVDSAGAITATLAELPTGEVAVEWAGRVASVPFPNPFLWSVSVEAGRAVRAYAHLAGSKAGTIELQVADLSGGPGFQVSVPFERQPIPRDVADSAVAAWRERFQDARSVDDSALIPPAYPPITGVHVGLDGAIWLEFRPMGAGRRYQVLAPDGAAKGQLHLPMHQQLADASDQTILVVETDQHDLESVVAYRVDWDLLRSR